MPDMLLNKLEEKMMALLSEVEDLRKETKQLSQDNAALKASLDAHASEKVNHTKKLEDLISLLDAVNVGEEASSAMNKSMAAQPMLMQVEA